MEEQIREFQGNSEQGFRYFFNLYYPRIHFFIYRAVNNAEAVKMILQRSFTELAMHRSLLHTGEEILSFLYACSGNQNAEFKRKNDFLSSKKELMGYVISDRVKSPDVPRIYSETMYLLIKGIEAIPVSFKEALSHYSPTIIFQSPKRNNSTQAPAVAIPHFISASILFQLFPDKNPPLTLKEREELDQWLAADFEHMLLIDELRDRKNIELAEQFFRKANAEENYASIRRHIKFARPDLFKSLKRFFG
ncbi:MAG: hypothetical protein ABI687_06180 [Flavitalea sp.]